MSRDPRTTTATSTTETTNPTTTVTHPTTTTHRRLTATPNRHLNPSPTPHHRTRRQRTKKLHHPMRGLPWPVCNDTAAHGSGVVPC